GLAQRFQARAVAALQDQGGGAGARVFQRQRAADAAGGAGDQHAGGYAGGRGRRHAQSDRRMGGLGRPPETTPASREGKPVVRRRNQPPLFEQAAQHPGVLLVDVHALGQQVGGGLVVGGVGLVERGPGGLGDRFVALDQQAHHFHGVWHVAGLGNGRQLGELAVRARRMHAQGADALGDVVERGPFFG